MDTGRLPIWLKFLDETSKVVTTLTAVVILYTRSAGVAYFVTGAVLCSGLAKVVKRAIRQERPPQQSGRKVTYGMPSSHACTCTFFATYITFACLQLPVHPALPRSAILAPVVVLPWTFMIVMSRVQLGHHTWPQVAAGSALGACCASFWFKLWMDDASGVRTTTWAVEAMIESWVDQ
ncbi:PAP2-domain-containing protein [Rhizopogon vinicolor AM-OR11-026]|uniref:PAP2-domain-containing protein n=1 Tax=Rhizopogon vinicolor AM-OR11-026 TaxID=1314800 RepID=A0A1B7NII5_9AGAM|nr:PAP2-domain-containing protein [Rhizopogon vinicolor AM-OR11-026]